MNESCGKSPSRCSVVFRDITRQHVEEGHDGGRVVVAQVHAELDGAHDFHGLIKRLHGPVVEVRGRLADVPQHRDSELVSVRFVFGRLESADVFVLRLRCKPVILDHAELLERFPAEEFSFVTIGAPYRQKQFQAILLFSMRGHRHHRQGSGRMARASAELLRRPARQARSWRV